MTIAELLKQSQLPMLERRMLLEYLLKVSRAWLMTHDDEVLTESLVNHFNKLEKRRLDGEPMAYLLGGREFMGLNFKVDSRVLIPRPDTETLVQQVLTCLPTFHTPIHLLDMGTGSGAIAISVAHYYQGNQPLKVYATDVSLGALELAKENASKYQVDIHFLQGSWFNALEENAMNLRFHMVVSNPPYIAYADPHLSEGDLRYEPRMALTDGENGLTAIVEIITKAPTYLYNGGQLWLEHGYDQAAIVRELLAKRGFSHVSSVRDLAGIERISGGVWCASV